MSKNSELLLENSLLDAQKAISLSILEAKENKRFAMENLEDLISLLDAIIRFRGANVMKKPSKSIKTVLCLIFCLFTSSQVFADGYPMIPPQFMAPSVDYAGPLLRLSNQLQQQQADQQQKNYQHDLYNQQRLDQRRQMEEMQRFQVRQQQLEIQRQQAQPRCVTHAIRDAGSGAILYTQECN